MPVPNPLIALIGQAKDRLLKMHLTLAKELSIMGTSLTAEDGNEATTGEVGHHLRLQSVLPFLAAVEVPLFFCGRSTGTSVTSTRATSVLSSGSNSWRLLDNRN